VISELYLEITQNNNCKSFLIEDASIYNENTPITCGTLRVKVPGYNRPKYYEVESGFAQTVTMTNLDFQEVGHYDSLGSLPDGLYTIHYSINPNDKLFVEYYHYQNCNIYKLYMDAVCNFISNKCDYSKQEQIAKVEELWNISVMIDYAKISAEECGNSDVADEFYNEAMAKLKKEGTNGCKTCR